METEFSIKTPSCQYNAATEVTQGYQEIRNTAENWQTIMEKIISGKAKDISLESKKDLRPCFITGSGPSFDKTVEKLKKWKGGIITHYSQAVTLMYYGIEPDYIVALDAICNWEGLQSVDWSKTKTKLITHPGMWPSLIENWPNGMLLYRQNLGNNKSFTMHEQKIMFTEREGTLEDALSSQVKLRPLILTEMTLFACTPPAQLFVAQLLGYGTIFLTGIDFAYLDGKERFTNYVKENGEWVKQEHFLDPNKKEFVITENLLKTDPLHMYYKKNFLSACRLSMQNIYTTDQGAITELKYMDIDKVIENYPSYKMQDKKEVALKIESYLAKVKCFVIEYEKGYSFVEAANPIPDLTNYMKMMNRRYVCTTCGANFNANDDIDYNGVECNMCHNKTVKQSNPINIDLNLRKMERLIGDGK
ncbi:MAG: 6-hydroxymethylpterin diphosphokinase MptE-like protein [Ignavibacteria bacterium]